MPDRSLAPYTRDTFGIAVKSTFGVGAIKCCSADKTLGDFEIKNIKKPREVKEMLSQAAEEQRGSKRVSSREFLTSEDDTEED